MDKKKLSGSSRHLMIMVLMVMQVVVLLVVVVVRVVAWVVGITMEAKERDSAA